MKNLENVTGNRRQYPSDPKLFVSASQTKIIHPAKELDFLSEITRLS
jgi:hypothetical protein